MLTTTSPARRPNASRRRLVVHVDDVLHFEIVVAGAERSHLVALPPLGRIGDPGGIGAGHRAALLDALEILRPSVAAIDSPARPAAEHRVHLRRSEPQRAGAAHACRYARKQRVRQQSLHRLDLRAREPGQQRAHAAGNVETHAARRHDAALIGVEGGHPADRKAVSPMRIRHRKRCLDDARQRGDVGDLLGDLVVHSPDQRLVRIDDPRHPHLPGLRQLPLVAADPLQPSRIHGLSLPRRTPPAASQTRRPLPDLRPSRRRQRAGWALRHRPRIGRSMNGRRVARPTAPCRSHP